MDVEQQTRVKNLSAGDEFKTRLTGMEDKPSVLPFSRLQRHLRRIHAPPPPHPRRAKGNFTGARIPKLPGGNSRPSGPWHSSCSMWKIHFSWLKGLASSPLPQSTPQQRARVSQKVRGRVSGSWGQEGSHHDDCSPSPRRIPSLSEGKSSAGTSTLRIICVCLGCFKARICYCCCSVLFTRHMFLVIMKFMKQLLEACESFKLQWKSRL